MLAELHLALDSIDMEETGGVLIDGIVGPALLDSGLQVTTVCQSFYQGHLSSHVPLEKLGTKDLSVEGEGGQLVQYDGFIRVKMRFPKDVVAQTME